MKIEVDKEAHDLLKKFCDIALKAGGLMNLQPTLLVLNSMKLVEKDEEKCQD